jgi:hypothetical protein
MVGAESAALLTTVDDFTAADCLLARADGAGADTGAAMVRAGEGAWADSLEPQAVDKAAAATSVAANPATRIDARDFPIAIPASTSSRIRRG